MNLNFFIIRLYKVIIYYLILSILIDPDPINNYNIISRSIYRVVLMYL